MGLPKFCNVHTSPLDQELLLLDEEDSLIELEDDWLWLELLRLE
jgi:hypothetical protein